MCDSLFAAAAAILLVPAAASACAMNSPSDPARGHCQVAGAEKLAASAFDSERICSLIMAAISEGGPRSGFSVRAEVQSAYHVSAIVTLADGRTLPEVHTASSDRPLSDRSFRMLGKAIATKISGSAR